MQTLNVSKKTKKTSIGEIPVDWKVMHLGDAIKDIGDGGTPDTKISEYFNGGIPWATVEDIKFNISSTRQTISGLGLKNSSAKLWPPQTVILTTGATIGRVGLSDFPLATKQGITGIVCDEFCLIPEFLARFFEFKKRFLNRIAQGSTFKEVRAPILKQLLLALPPLSEQRKIAEILSSIDSVIEKTQSVIDQTQTLKKGLMQELFTHGLPGRHKKFKKTEIGEIPEEWEVKFINDVCLINPPKKEISKLSRDITVSFIPMENIAAEGGGIISREERKLAEVEVGYTYFTEGDIIFAKITPCMENGKVAIMTDLINNIGFGSTEFHVLRARDDLIVRKFLFYWVTRKIFRSLAMNYFTGTAGQQRIQAYFFSIAKIPLPPKEEQKEIIKILEKIDSSVTFKTQEITQLSYLKSALMQILLTGEVRVKV